MRRAAPAVLLVALVAGLAACGGGGGEGGAEPAAVELTEVGGSGQSGTATLTATGDDSFEVVLELTASEFPTQPAHIHSGTCAEYAALGDDLDAQLATVENTLRDVVDGASTTEIQLTALAERTTGGFSINVHEPGSPFPSTACGDIPAR